MATSAIILVSILSISLSLYSTFAGAKVDPSWLASWNEAWLQKPSELKSITNLANSSEAGIKLVVDGRVFDPFGKPAEGVIVHAYHRDNKGFDFGFRDKELTTWRIQGWVITDSQGRFTLQTIRPAPDFLGREGGHIHFTTISEKYGRQWALKAYFYGDPLLTEQQKIRSEKAGMFGAIRRVNTTENGEQINVAIKMKIDSDF